MRLLLRGDGGSIAGNQTILLLVKGTEDSVKIRSDFNEIVGPQFEIDVDSVGSSFDGAKAAIKAKGARVFSTHVEDSFFAARYAESNAIDQKGSVQHCLLRLVGIQNPAAPSELAFGCVI